MDSERSLEAFGWAEPVDTPTLGEQEVHLWSVCLDALNELSEQCWGWLSNQEQQRAMCFQFAVDRQRFTNAHVAVRAILAQYARCHPVQLSFGQNAFGKPFITSMPQDQLRFNITHGTHHLLCAVVNAREVGVDLEPIDLAMPTDEIAHMLFTKREQALLKSLPVSERQHAFYVYWTRKEAIVKAQGMGLSLPLDSFEVVSCSSGLPQLVATNTKTAPSQYWSLYDVPHGSAFAAALAVEGVQATIRPMIWNQRWLATYLGTPS